MTVLRADSWLLLGFAIVALGVACGPVEEESTAQPAAAAEEAAAESQPAVKRVVLVTIDTLRADHVGGYGYPRNTTPFLDSLAAQGVRFENAYAAMSMTVPAHASIFTSLYPLQHSAMQNGHVVNDAFMTMAMLFQEHGYETAAFVAVDRLFEKANLHRGFDTWNQTATSMRDYRRADATVDAAIEWINQVPPEKPFFVWVHVFDPHTPYRTDPDVLAGEQMMTEAERQAFVDFQVKDRDIRFRAYDRSNEKLIDRMNKYDAEVRFVDDHVRRLHETLTARGLFKDAVFVVTADHGEGLGSHGYMDHSRKIWEEQVRVPLIMQFSSGAFSGGAPPFIVQHVDLLPTFADLIGAREALTKQAIPVEGRSLMPLLRGKPAAPGAKNYAFMQRRTYANPDEAEEKGDEYAIRTGPYKLFYRTELNEGLYDLGADPCESQNLVNADTHTAMRDDLIRRIEAKIERLKATQLFAPTSIDQEGQERLEALGYIH